MKSKHGSAPRLAMLLHTLTTFNTLFIYSISLLLRMKYTKPKGLFLQSPMGDHVKFKFFTSEPAPYSIVFVWFYCLLDFFVPYTFECTKCRLMSNYLCMFQMWFQRASRTDKGVSAAGQVFSFLISI